jgi:uncharacterized membrane protein YdjX (TVP38/TMEM64 family)
MLPKVADTGTSSWRSILWVILAAALVPIIPFAVIGELPGEKWLQASGDHSLLFALTGSALLAADLALPIPSSILGTLLGARLGFAAGATAAFVGLFAGSVIGYWIGRLVHRVRRPRRDAPEPPAGWLVFVSRPVPVLAEAVAIAAGVEAVGFGRFVIASAAGNALYAIAMAGSGATLPGRSHARSGDRLAHLAAGSPQRLERRQERRCSHKAAHAGIPCYLERR